MNHEGAGAANMARRYARATDLTPVMVAARTPGNGVDGYWLDDHRFFFLAERFEAGIGRIVVTPTIADSLKGEIAPILSLGVLSELLSHAAGTTIDLETLAGAEYDMPDADRLVVCLGGKTYHIDAQKGRLVSTGSLPETAELYSPDGKLACFLKGPDMWLRDRQTGATRALTSDGAASHAYGQQAESSLSAVSYRASPFPLGLWSPDSEWFVTHRIDERQVPQLSLVQHAPPDGGKPIVHSYRYPMPGDPVPMLVYTVFHVATGRTITSAEFPAVMQVFSPFTLRSAWFSAGCDYFFFLRANRYQSDIELIEIDLATGASRVVLAETATSGYIDLHPIIAMQPNVRTLPESKEVIWFSERDGHGHLFLYDAATGALKNQITHGEWLVRDIVHIDAGTRRILFLAGGMDAEEEPGIRRLCAVNFDGTDLQTLLIRDGDVAVQPSPCAGVGQNRPFRPSYAPVGASLGGRFVAFRQSSIDRGSRTAIADLQTGKQFNLAEVDAASTAQGVPPRRFEALADDQVTRLHGALFFPSDFDETQIYPLIDYCYPGPQSAWLPRTFRSLNAAQAQTLAELGFVTMMLDSRGLPLRSRAFHHAGYGSLFEPQLRDHAAVIEQVCARHSFLDRQRVGVIGQSAGGYLAARAMLDYPETFKVGVSICGNHDPRYYASMWMEKYVGGDNNELWKTQANTCAAYKLQGKLFLITGEMDENVHPSHTLALAAALMKINKDFELLIVPNEGHGVLMTNPYVQRRIWDYFVRNLLGETPMAEYELKYKLHDIEAWGKVLMRESFSS
jgi:dipeptidyl-peptidase 4